MSEWQDISTAPKDGTWILTFEEPISTSGKCFQVLRWARSGWSTWNSFGDYKDPTHWMPLPVAPSSQQEQTK